MIIQCPHCQSRFKLATEKIKPGGTKVRCTRCKSIFIVTPPEKGQTASVGSSGKIGSQDEWTEFSGAGDESEKGPDFDQDESPAWGEKIDFLGGDYDPAEFFKAEDEDAGFFLNGETADFPPEPAGQAPVESDASATDSSEELLHDWTEEESSAVVEAAPEGFPDGQKPPLVLAEEAPPAESAGHSGMDAGRGELLQVELDAVPPLPTVSPKRSAKGPVLLLVLLVAALGVLGYQYGRDKLPWLTAYLKRLQGVPEVPSVAGKLVPVDFRGYYVENNREGRLFVIQGKILNEFIEARASISVAGLVYDRQGKVIARQTAYCGNAMSKSQLRSQSFARMAERMNNEFGELLTNINVEPNKAVPFTIVFRVLPDEVAEFGVEVLDSKPVAK